MTGDERKWRAVEARDAAADGAFVYAVATTGVYCRPSCSSRTAKRANIRFYDSAADALDAGYRACKRCGGAPARTEPAAAIGAKDWSAVADALDAHGAARIGPVLSERDCAALRALWMDETRFRSTVDMARHGFGAGAYRYFAEPIPEPVETLRREAYARLAPIANRWMEALDKPHRYPPTLAGMRALCAEAGQSKPTPLLLRYGPGGHNRLHQDLYGALAFPLQMVVLLSAPGAAFTGGELALTEQKPRAQSRVEVLTLGLGEAAIFATNERPAQGTRGVYRARMRHGVSQVRSGERMTLGIIFHDAA